MKNSRLLKFEEDEYAQHDTACMNVETHNFSDQD